MKDAGLAWGVSRMLVCTEAGLAQMCTDARLVQACLVCFCALMLGWHRCAWGVSALGASRAHYRCHM